MRKSNGIQIDIDPDMETVYIRLTTNRVKRTQLIETDVLVDFDARGRPVGLEFLDKNRIASGLRVFRRRYRSEAFRRIRPTALQRLFAG